MADDVLLAISTFPDAETASRVAREIVTARLAACANVGAPVQSIYHWQGKVEEAQEVVVFFKTTNARWEKFQATLRSLHPYEVPEIVAVPVVGGLPDYLQWVADECAQK